MKCGFQARHQGTTYLLSAMELYTPGMQLTKELYPQVARMYGTSPAAVERGIRVAIAYAAATGTGNLHDTIVGKYLNRSVGEVLARLDCLQKWGEWDED